jgi:cupin superfamily acireductone dioxygenase involved in methionine salvage
MTFIFEDPPYHHSGRHKHLEAMIYILEGEGYSEVQGRDEHYNNSSRICKQLRIQFGIRYWFTDIWPEGYTAQRIFDETGQPITAGPIHSPQPEEKTPARVSARG